jgi:hypothetical protein
MLDGRIDTQGTVQDFRERGVLEDNERDPAVNVHKEQVAAAEATAVEEGTDINTAKAVADEDMTAVKKPRKFVRLRMGFFYNVSLTCS